MREETKEEYIARHRKELGIIITSEKDADMPVKKVVSIKERLTALFFIVLLALFLWVIVMMFGMMKAN